MDYGKELFLMQQSYAALFALTNKLQVKADSRLAPLTSRQYMTMMAIAHLEKEGTTLNAIALKLSVTKQNVKQLITILKKKGYVSTVPSPKDKRAVNVLITEVGKQVLLEASEEGIYFLADLFADFSAEELKMLWHLLQKMYRFDGESQDGFEDAAGIELDEKQQDLQKRVLQEFKRRRMKS